MSEKTIHQQYLDLLDKRIDEKYKDILSQETDSSETTKTHEARPGVDIELVGSLPIAKMKTPDMIDYCSECIGGTNCQCKTQMKAKVIADILKIVNEVHLVWHGRRVGRRVNCNYSNCPYVEIKQRIKEFK